MFNYFNAFFDEKQAFVRARDSKF